MAELVPALSLHSAWPLPAACIPIPPHLSLLGLLHTVRRSAPSGSAASGMGCLEEEPGWPRSVPRGPEQGGKWRGGQSRVWVAEATAVLHGRSWPWFGPFPWNVVLAAALSRQGHLGPRLLGMASALG